MKKKKFTKRDWIYTLRTAYVGMCGYPHDRIPVHKHSKSRPVSIHIRKLLAEGRELITVFEECVCESEGRYGYLVESDYIKGYSRLLGDRLMNVSCNPARRKANFMFAHAGCDPD